MDTESRVLAQIAKWNAESKARVEARKAKDREISRDLRAYKRERDAERRDQ
jgi:hypothetical protein